MKLSSKSRYAMRAMMYLAEHGQKGPQSLSRIKECGLPGDYLEQLLRCLRQEGLVRSVRGNQGGYQLTRPASDITVGEVIAAVEGPAMLQICGDKPGNCEAAAHCSSNMAWAKLIHDIEAFMAQYSLEDMLTYQTTSGGTA